MARTYGLCVCSPAGVPLITFTIRRSILTPQNRNSFILLYFSSSSFVPAGCGEWCECISAWTVLLFVRLDVCFSHAVRRTIDDGAPSIHFVHFYFISFSIERRERERESTAEYCSVCSCSSVDETDLFFVFHISSFHSYFNSFRCRAPIDFE